MHRRLNQAALGTALLTLLACSGGGDSKATTTVTGGASVSTSAMAVFDPAGGNVPLPNVLVTGSVTSVTYTDTHTPAAGTLNISPGYPLTPDQALAYVNLKEMGGTHAVSGLNAPIFLQFSSPVDSSTANGTNIKVFKLVPDNPADPSSTENNQLGFTDITGQFTFSDFTAPTYTATGTVINPNAWGVYALPKVPLLPGTRYLYVVTSGVHDATTHQSVLPSDTFQLMKSASPIAAPDSKLAALEAIRADVLVPTTTNIQLRGYQKVMNDLIAATAIPAVTTLGNITLIGRFITTGAGFVPPDPAGSASTRYPMEMALWAWANNAGAGGVIPHMDFSTGESRAWNNGVSNFKVVGTSTVPDAASADVEVTGSGSIGSIFRRLDPVNAGHLMYIPHTNVGQVAWGSFQSADFQLDPYIVHAATPAPAGNLDAVFAATPALYNPGTSTAPGTGILQASRNAGFALRGFYHKTRTVPFVIITPAITLTKPVPPGGFPVAIFMHGIGRSKEDVLSLANTLCTAGYAVVSIDQAVHGFPGGVAGSLTPTAITTGMGNGQPQAEWASNFFMLPSSLTARTNGQTSAFNLWRLERILKQPTIDPTSLQAAMAATGSTINNIAPTLPGAGATQFIGQSLGSITGAYFLAGNSSQTGGGNMKGLLSVPGGRVAWVLKESPSFAKTVADALAANHVPAVSAGFYQFFALTQAVLDPVDPATMGTPIPGQGASRLGAGRILVQEAVGDSVIQNACGQYFVNAIAGRKPQFGADTSVSFTQVLRTTNTTLPAVQYVYGGSLGDFDTFKAAVAPDTATGASHPTQGVMQYGTSTTAASHGVLLDNAIPADTAAAQRQAAIWVATGKVADGSDASNGYRIVTPLSGNLPLGNLPGLPGPESLVIHFPASVQP